MPMRHTESLRGSVAEKICCQNGPVVIGAGRSQFNSRLNSIVIQANVQLSEIAVAWKC